MQRAHAQISRASPARVFARYRQRRKVADALVVTVGARATQGVELGGDAKALAPGRFGTVRRCRRDGESTFDIIDNEAVASDWQHRQRDWTLRDGAPVGQLSPDTVGGVDRPFGGGAVFALDPRIYFARRVAQRRDERLATAQHKREGQATAPRLIDEAC